MTSPEIDLTPNRVKAGNFLQTAANTMCRLRVIIGAGIAASHVLSGNPYSWKRATGAAGNYAQDKVDGLGAREAAELLQRPPTPEGKSLDERSDKQLHRVTAAAHAIRAIFRERQTLYGLVTAGNLVAQEVRDAAVHKSRDAAVLVSEATGVAIDTGATKASKRKLAAVAVGDIAGDSPLPRHRLGRALDNAAQTAGTILSYRTGGEIIESLDHQMRDAISGAAPTPEYQNLVELTELDQRQRAVVLVGRLLRGNFDPPEFPPTLAAEPAHTAA